MANHYRRQLNFTSQGVQESFLGSGDIEGWIQTADTHESADGIRIESQLGTVIEDVDLYAAFMAGQTGKQVSLETGGDVNVTILPDQQKVSLTQDGRHVETSVPAEEFEPYGPLEDVRVELNSVRHNWQRLDEDQQIRTGRIALAIMQAREQLEHPVQ